MHRAKLVRAILSIVLTALISGCAGIQLVDPLAPSTNLAKTKAYVYGQFKLYRGPMNITRLYVRMENLDTGALVDLRLRSDDQSIYAAEIDPGTYRVKEIIFTPGGPSAWLFSAEVRKIQFPPSVSYLSQPATMEPGKAYYIGDFYGETGRSEPAYNVVRFSGYLTDVRQDFAGTTRALKGRLPAFTDMECLPAYEPRDRAP